MLPTEDLRLCPTEQPSGMAWKERELGDREGRLSFRPLCGPAIDNSCRSSVRSLSSWRSEGKCLVPVRETGGGPKSGDKRPKSSERGRACLEGENFSKRLQIQTLSISSSLNFGQSDSERVYTQLCSNSFLNLVTNSKNNSHDPRGPARQRRHQFRTQSRRRSGRTDSTLSGQILSPLFSLNTFQSITTVARE